MLNLAKWYPVSGSVCVDLVSISLSVFRSAGVFGVSVGAGGAIFFFLQWRSTNPSVLAGFVKADCSLGSISCMRLAALEMLSPGKHFMRPLRPRPVGGLLDYHRRGSVTIQSE